MTYRYIDRNKVGGIENIIKVYVDSLIFENDILKKEIIDRIKESRRDMKLFINFQFPIVKIVADKEFEGLGLYEVSILKDELGIETFKDVDQFIESLNSKILSKSIHILSATQRYKKQS